VAGGSTMNRTRLALTVLAITLAGVVAAIANSAADLPPQVASHFNAAGQPDGWTSRTSYLWSMIAMVCGLSLLMVAIFYGVRFCPPSTINLPNRDYWLAPERRDETFAFVFRAGVWLALLQAALFLGIHLLVVAANKAQPVRLSRNVWGLLGGFLVAILAWSCLFVWRFRRPPAARAQDA
jgi:serine/threonine-protein kinase